MLRGFFSSLRNHLLLSSFGHADFKTYFVKGRNWKEEKNIDFDSLKETP